MFHFSYGGSLVYDGSLSGGGFVAFCFVAAQVTMAAAAVPLLVAGTRRAAAAARRAVTGGPVAAAAQVAAQGRPHASVCAGARDLARRVSAQVTARSRCRRRHRRPCRFAALPSLCRTDDGHRTCALQIPSCSCVLAGLLTAIVGETGSGGVSLALLATRMESPTSGCVALDDTGEGVFQVRRLTGSLMCHHRCGHV